MAISVYVNGIQYPSRMAYYRTLEEQGACSDASFYVHMRLKHDPMSRKNESDHTSKARMYYHIKKNNLLIECNCFSGQGVYKIKCFHIFYGNNSDVINQEHENSVFSKTLTACFYSLARNKFQNILINCIFLFSLT